MSAAVACLLGAALGAGGGAAPDLDATVRAVTNLIAGVSGLPPDRLQEVLVRFRGDSLRIEFQDAKGRDFALLRRAGGVYVLLDARGGALPVPGAALNLVLDPVAPCARMGVLARCTRVGEGLYAGRDAVHWRYGHAHRHGPGGTDAGEMWLDRQTGLALSYVAASLGKHGKVWDVLEVSYAPVEAAWFGAERASVGTTE